MQKQLSTYYSKAVGAALSACKSTPFLLLAHARGQPKLRIALPAAPRQRLCALARSVRKQLRSAELAFWQASGGDFLSSDYATDRNLLPTF